MENVLQCKLFPAHLLENLKYVVVCSWYKGQWLFSRKKGSDAWETQGGHIEPGETPEQAAKREMYEESGVKDATLYYVCAGWTATTCSTRWATTRSALQTAQSFLPT